MRLDRRGGERGGRHARTHVDRRDRGGAGHAEHLWDAGAGPHARHARGNARRSGAGGYALRDHAPGDHSTDSDDPARDHSPDRDSADDHSACTARRGSAPVLAPSRPSACARDDRRHTTGARRDPAAPDADSSRARSGDRAAHRGSAVDRTSPHPRRSRRASAGDHSARRSCSHPEQRRGPQRARDPLRAPRSSRGRARAGARHPTARDWRARSAPAALTLRSDRARRPSRRDRPAARREPRYAPRR
jgi:hypothetical protein